MPKFEVVYTTECRWVVIVEADDIKHAQDVWADEAYWDREPEMFGEDMLNVNVFEMEEENA